MRLDHLLPVFYGHFSADSDKTTYRRVEQLDEAQGFEFWCPRAGCHHRVLMWFANPHGGVPVPVGSMPGHRFHVTGSSPTDLSIIFPGSDAREIIVACGAELRVLAGEVTLLR